jgi:altronate dehydratase
VKPVLVISDRDNVATALEPLEPGRRIDSAVTWITVIEPIASGHKVALRSIHAGEAVIKYGSPIGLATCDIRAGAHVHTHNLASSRGRGDLSEPPAAPRLAEPSDERTNMSPASKPA